MLDEDAQPLISRSTFFSSRIAFFRLPCRVFMYTLTGQLYRLYGMCRFEIVFAARLSMDMNEVSRVFNA